MASQTHISPLLFLAAIATAAAKLTPEWRVVSAAKGVTTRARIDATSQLCAVHGEAVVEASVAELMSVFGDLDQHGHWDATLVDAREWTGADGGTYVYQRFKQPWPVRDRELVLRRREWRRNQTVSVHFESVDEGTPVAPGAVRTLAHGASVSLRGGRLRRPLYALVQPRCDLTSGLPRSSPHSISSAP